MNKLKYEFVKEQIENSGYKLLSKEYIGVLSNLKVECPKGHQYKVTYNNFQQGYRCPICFGNNQRQRQKFTYEYIKEQFEKEGYELLSKEYVNTFSKLKVECDKKHQYEVRYSNFQQGRRCPICWESIKYSQSEKDCLDVVKQIIPNEIIIENDRNQIINSKTNQFLELDIYIPKLKKAIEFNGEYWHDNEYSKYKDGQKQIQCKEKDIDLIVILYQDWIDNRKEQIDNLKEFLNEKS